MVYTLLTCNIKSMSACTWPLSPDVAALGFAHDGAATALLPPFFSTPPACRRSPAVFVGDTPTIVEAAVDFRKEFEALEGEVEG